jgi:methyl-accepting chemotaxis protein
LNPDEIHLIRKTFAEMERSAHVAALIFYRRLYLTAPALQPLFKTGVEEQSRKFMDMLAFAISRLERPEQLLPELEALGARHLEHGVEQSHYGIVETALLGMVEETLGKKFTPEVDAAWRRLYGLMAGAMKAGADKAAKFEASLEKNR